MNRKGYTLVEALLVLAIVGIMLGMAVGFKGCFGVGGCGPVNNPKHCKIVRLWVDNLGESGSAYMVSTDKGVFEVDNGIMLGMWNADRLYGSLQVGHVYDFKTKGKTVEFCCMQEYPRIVEAVEVVEPKPEAAK